MELSATDQRLHEDAETLITTQLIWSDRMIHSHWKYMQRIHGETQ